MMFIPTPSVWVAMIFQNPSIVCLVSDTIGWSLGTIFSGSWVSVVDGVLGLGSWCGWWALWGLDLCCVLSQHTPGLGSCSYCQCVWLQYSQCNPGHLRIHVTSSRSYCPLLKLERIMSPRRVFKRQHKHFHAWHKAFLWISSWSLSVLGNFPTMPTAKPPPPAPLPLSLIPSAPSCVSLPFSPNCTVWQATFPEELCSPWRR